jgi:hypothetical protein
VTPVDFSTHECVPWIQYRSVGERFEVRDMRPKSPEAVDPPEVFTAENMGEVHKFAADRSKTGEYVPVGDFVKWLADTLGIPSCEGCERRRACLNRLLGI